MYAELPDIEEDEPTPTNSLGMATIARPWGMRNPVPMDPTAVIIVPARMSGTLPILSAILPRGMLHKVELIEGSAIRRPIPLAPKPICCANKGSTGTTWETPMFSMS
jgi:hypothetical protein